MAANTGTALGNGSIPLAPSFQAYTPSFTGATDNPTATYTTQVGRFYLVGNLCFFKYNVVTSTMTKTTTSDNFQVSLPLPAATNTNDIVNFAAKLTNATAVAQGILGEIASANQFATFRIYQITGAATTITWATTTPGIGVITNTVTATGGGFYEYQQL